MKNGKVIWSVCIFVLLLAFVFTSVGAISPGQGEKSPTELALAKYQAAQGNADLSDEEKIKAAIEAYFTLRYEGQKLLAAQDFSSVIDDKTLDWVKQEQDKREIEIYIASLYNTPYKSYSYTLDYDAVDIGKEKASVQLRESNEIITLPDLVTSKMGNLQHTFTLHNKKGAWVIYKDEYEDELSLGLKRQTKADLLKQVDENYQKQNRKTSASAKAVLADLAAQPLALTNYSYSKTLAKNYADTYWNTTNPPYYLAVSGNDCANFVSQAMYAGEGKTPPNTNGMTTSPTRSPDNDWYYVWNNSGSAPWVGVLNNTISLYPTLMISGHMAQAQLPPAMPELVM